MRCNDMPPLSSSVDERKIMNHFVVIFLSCLTLFGCGDAALSLFGEEEFGYGLEITNSESALDS